MGAEGAAGGGGATWAAGGAEKEGIEDKVAGANAAVEFPKVGEGEMACGGLCR
jgi:hypothetical protein